MISRGKGVWLVHVRGPFLLSSEASEEQTCLLFRASDDKIPRGLATVMGMLPVLSLPNSLRSWRREGFISDERRERWESNAFPSPSRGANIVFYILEKCGMMI